MKLTMKLFLIISLFCSTALADGDMDNGSRTGGSGGGLACAECVIDDQSENKGFEKRGQKEVENSLMIFIRDFFSKMLF